MSESPLHVQVGDVIVRGSGDHATVVTIVWTNRTHQPGARDALGTDSEQPSAKATPVDAICLVAPVGDGQFAGTAMLPAFLRYLGALEFSDEQIDAASEADDDFAAREGHTWEVTVPGYRHVTHHWWDTFRNPIPDLTEHDRQVAERAWDEGIRAGLKECNDLQRNVQRPQLNPYRAAKGEQK